MRDLYRRLDLGFGADAAQIDMHRLVRHRTQRLRDTRRGIELGGMALAIAHAQRVDGEALFLGHGNDGG